MTKLLYHWRSFINNFFSKPSFCKQMHQTSGETHILEIKDNGIKQTQYATPCTNPFTRSYEGCLNCMENFLIPSSSVPLLPPIKLIFISHVHVLLVTVIVASFWDIWNLFPSSSSKDTPTNPQKLLISSHLKQMPLLSKAKPKHFNSNILGQAHCHSWTPVYCPKCHLDLKIRLKNHCKPLFVLHPITNCVACYLKTLYNY